MICLNQVQIIRYFCKFLSKFGFCVDSEQKPPEISGFTLRADAEENLFFPLVLTG